MTTRERLLAALDGGVPDVTPLSIYSWMISDKNDPRWQRLLEQGLGLCHHWNPYAAVEHGVEDSYEEKTEGGNHYRIHYRKTPVGTLRQMSTNGWHTEYLIKEPRDYATMQWIVEHTEILPRYETYAEYEAFVGDQGIVAVTGSRTPAMSINVDWAGTEQFCMDVAMEVEELFGLYEARTKKFMEEIEIMAAGPGHIAKFFENLTISMIGPQRYGDLLVSVYEQAMPKLHAAGMRSFVHYDGALQVIADKIQAAPFDGIESLTEPPEGDMTYDQCRAAWPEKSFWANINLDCYALPTAQLQAEVIAKRERAGKRGLAFEISEDLPGNWETAIPVVLQALEMAG